MDIRDYPIFYEPGKITPVCVSIWNLQLEKLYGICMLVEHKQKEKEAEKKYKKQLKELKKMKLWGPSVDNEKFKPTMLPIEEAVGKEQ